MKSLKLVFLLALLMGLVAGQAFATTGAAIYCDENFEDDDPFTELNWPLLNNAQFPQQATIAVTQGYEVRADVIGSTKPMSGFTLAGVVDVNDTRFYTGTQSLSINKGGRVQSEGSTNLPVAKHAGFGVLQMALSVNPSGAGADAWDSYNATLATLRLKQTVVLADKLPTAGTNTNINFDVKLVGNGSDAVNVIAQHPTVTTETITIGTIGVGEGEWAMVTYLWNNRVTTPDQANDAPQPWVCYDVGSSGFDGRRIYIGPQPLRDLTPEENGFGLLQNWAQIETGMYIFCNSNAAGVTYVKDEINEFWGNIDGATANHINMTREEGWQLNANGTRVFVDDLYWDVNGHDNPQSPDSGVTWAGAARMQPFDNTGLAESPPLAVRIWHLYE